MKQVRKAQSPYFRKRSSFQSPQCSTVVEVNPSCESQESMLQKIIFTDQIPSSKRMQRIQNNFQRQKVLQQRNMDHLNTQYNFSKMDKNPNYKEPTKYNQAFEQKYQSYRQKDNQTIKQNITGRFNYLSYQTSRNELQQGNRNEYPSKRLNSVSSTNNIRSFNEKSSSKNNLRAESYQSSQLKKNYSIEKQIYQINNEQHEQRAIIDEQRLHKIQQKIRRHQMKNKQTNFQTIKVQKNHNKKQSLRDNLQNQLQNIQIDFAPKIKKKQTIINNLSFEDEKCKKMQNPKQNLGIQRQGINYKQNMQEKTQKNNRLDRRKLLQRCLQKIYTLVSIDSTVPLSVQNINLKLLSVQQVKLILGPLFTEVRIRNKAFNKQQFVQRALDLFSHYKEREIEDILEIFTLQTGPIQRNHQICTNQTKARIPGKLLSNSKTGLRKQQQNFFPNPPKQTQKNIQSQNFSKFQFRNQNYEQEPLHSNRNEQKTATKVSKNVYMQPTQTDEGYQVKYREIYETESNLNENPLELMLASQKAKRKYVSNRIQEQKVTSEDDEQLQRLNNLQKRFNEHFSNRK